MLSIGLFLYNKGILPKTVKFLLNQVSVSELKLKKLRKLKKKYQDLETPDILPFKVEFEKPKKESIKIPSWIGATLTLLKTGLNHFSKKDKDKEYTEAKDKYLYDDHSDPLIKDILKNIKKECNEEEFNLDMEDFIDFKGFKDDFDSEL